MAPAPEAGYHRPGLGATRARLDAAIGRPAWEQGSAIVWNIAHRGASGYAPENTRAAFDLAIAMGATAIETDLRMTCDGAIVLFHDPTVDRRDQRPRSG